MANKLTPRFKTITVDDVNWVSIEIGLWVGKRGRNNICLMLYYQGQPGRWYPPVMVIEELPILSKAANTLWNKYACPGCRGKGCSDCGNSGWKDYLLWESQGKKTDAENFPILEVS